MNNQPEIAHTQSLLDKHLPPDIFEKLKDLQTGSGFTLHDAVRSGRENPDSSVGIYAGDAETYRVFSEILDPMINEYHRFSNDRRHMSDLSPTPLEDPDPEHLYIVSTRIRAARNLDGFAFTPFISLTARRKVEQLFLKAVSDYRLAANSRYIAYENLSDKEFQTLAQSLPLFRKGDRFQESAGINRDFPKARGVFFSDHGGLLAWVNEEDHLRIISMDQGSDISGAFTRIADLLTFLENRINFAKDSRYGYLNACPSNIGTAMRAGVHIRLPGLDRQRNTLYRTAEKMNLQVRGTGGEKTGIRDSIFDISNKQRLGITETECIRTLHNGVAALIRMEQQLSGSL
ncbi:MAG: hypothetical protein K9J83_06820 [Desulfarculaceae bacterium]|nr:hypothetical protein [Desulfarculaceae bacterium]